MDDFPSRHFRSAKSIATRSEKLGSPALKERSRGLPSWPKKWGSAAQRISVNDQNASCPRTTVTGPGSFTFGNARTVANTSPRGTPTASSSHNRGCSTSAGEIPVLAMELNAPRVAHFADFFGLLRRKTQGSSHGGDRTYPGIKSAQPDQTAAGVQGSHSDRSFRRCSPQRPGHDRMLRVSAPVVRRIPDVPLASVWHHSRRRQTGA